MKLHLTRDSVAAGDDVDAPHFLVADIDENASTLELARQIQAMQYLASISGGEATWSIEADTPLAIIAQQLNEPKLIIQDNPIVKELAKGKDYLRVHINYHCQEDPDETIEKLKD